MATGALATGEVPLDRQVDRLVMLLRGRSVEGRPSIAAAINQHESSVRVFGESHRNVLHQIVHNPYVLVPGAAGTGKTLLGIEAAVRYASMGERVLFACWNVALGRWLLQAVRSRMAELGSPLADRVTDDPTGRIVVSYLGSLALQGRSVRDAVAEHTEDRGDLLPSAALRAAPDDHRRGVRRHRSGRGTGPLRGLGCRPVLGGCAGWAMVRVLRPYAEPVRGGRRAPRLPRGAP